MVKITQNDNDISSDFLVLYNCIICGKYPPKSKIEPESWSKKLIICVDIVNPPCF
nr:hypothetical protein Z952_p0116 [Clostridium botulinum C/D str. BKT75002]KEI05267.1 hypothetical protein Z954_0117 [Clostridium botulinum C/D str. BKT2873]